MRLARQTYDVIVVGAGILGLASAFKLQRARPHLRIAVVDKEEAVGFHQSGHNSGVIHSGLYYKPQSLKARLTTEGRRQMIAFSEEHAIPFDMCGKLVVAIRDSELPRMDELLRRGTANGISGLRRLGAEELREFEPHARGIAGIYSPSTGIIDYRAVTQALANEVRNGGGDIFLGEEIVNVHWKNSEATIVSSRGWHMAKNILTCAGLQSDRIADLTGAVGDDVRIIPFRGKYFNLVPAAATRVRSMIYPVPDPRFPFLGVHLTRHIDGSVSAGPNAVLALSREGYRGHYVSIADSRSIFDFPGFYKMAAQYWWMGISEVATMSKWAYARSCRRYIESLDADELVRGNDGIRAQAVTRDGQLVDDFVISKAPHVLNIRNAPSPGATASLAIGDWIVEQATQYFQL